MTAKKPVTIIDYGFGNVRSVLNALDVCGFEPQVVSTGREVEKSSSIVLPGVGAFATAMRVITNEGLDLAIREAVGSGAAVLGICLGMQLLFDKSLEFGEHLGLGLLEGTVGPLVPPENVSPQVKSTHISWAQVAPQNSGRLAEWFAAYQHEYYFVHSFAAESVPPAAVVGVSRYRGNLFVAAVETGKIAGVQFHPERSGEAGLGLFSRFFGDEHEQLES